MADFSVEVLAKIGGVYMSSRPGLPGVLQPAIGAFLTSLKQNLGDDLLGVWLFGSHARGEATQDSDVDLLILVPSATWVVRQQIYALAGSIGLAHTLLLNTLVWDPPHRDRHRLADTPIWQSLSREGIALWTT